jgi:hypothetical protein
MRNGKKAFRIHPSYGESFNVKQAFDEYGKCYDLPGMNLVV